MCNDHLAEASGTPARNGISRRAVISGVGAIAGLGLASLATPAYATRGAPVGTAAGFELTKGMQVVLLGTAGGPPVRADRYGISTAVVVNGSVYVVDAGRGSVSQYVHAGLKLATLRGIFVTHLHADHVAELHDYFLLGGNANQSITDSLPDRTPVFGPGRAGELPPPFGGTEPPIINPGNPTPGLADLFEYSHAAFAYSSNLFMRDSGIRNPTTLMDVRELTLPDVGASPDNRAPAMDPFVVMEDENVRVTAVLVPHGPAFPAFAYRIDSEHGSVTLSGDTTYTDNLSRLGDRTDILVHEAINVQGWAGPDALKAHLLEGHVEVQRVGEIAEACGAERLVLSHIGDLANPDLPVTRWKAWATQGYSGRVDVGQDLDIYTV